MKKTVPLHWGERGDPNRRLIGYAEVDTEGDRIDAVITDVEFQEQLGSSNLHVILSDCLPPHTKIAPDAVMD